MTKTVAGCPFHLIHPDSYGGQVATGSVVNLGPRVTRVGEGLSRRFRKFRFQKLARLPQGKLELHRRFSRGGGPDGLAKRAQTGSGHSLSAQSMTKGCGRSRAESSYRLAYVVSYAAKRS